MWYHLIWSQGRIPEEGSPAITHDLLMLLEVSVHDSDPLGEFNSDGREL